MDGVLVATDGYFDGRGAGVDEAQVAGWDVLTEEEEGFCRRVSGMIQLDPC